MVKLSWDLSPCSRQVLPCQNEMFLGSECLPAIGLQTMSGFFEVFFISTIIGCISWVIPEVATVVLRLEATPCALCNFAYCSVSDPLILHDYYGNLPFTGLCNYWCDHVPSCLLVQPNIPADRLRALLLEGWLWHEGHTLWGRGQDDPLH